MRHYTVERMVVNPDGTQTLCLFGVVGTRLRAGKIADQAKDAIETRSGVLQGTQYPGARTEHLTHRIVVPALNSAT